MFTQSGTKISPTRTVELVAQSRETRRLPPISSELPQAPPPQALLPSEAVQTLKVAGFSPFPPGDTWPTPFVRGNFRKSMGSRR